MALGRKRYRDAQGEREALAEECIDCGSAEIYGRDRCYRHYMADYRRERARRALQSPKTNLPIEAPARERAKAPKRAKPLTWYPQSDDDFEDGKARKVLAHLARL